MTKSSIALAAVVALAAASSAQAGFVTSDGLNPWFSPTSDSNSSLQIDYTTSKLTVDANVSVGDTFGTRGTLDGDPNVEIIETINNTSGFDWNGFNVNIQPVNSNQTVSNVTPIFDVGPLFKFSSASVNPSGSGFILSYGGGTVLNGTSVKLHFSFDIDATLGNDGTGIFNYSISNSPTPEPASLGVLGLGGVLLLRRRKA